MIPEYHPAAVWRPVHAAYYASAKPTAKDVTTIELNTRTKVAVITDNGLTKVRQLTTVDPFHAAEFYRDKVGYKMTWLNRDLILLTRKVGVKAPAPTLLRSAA